MLIWLISLDYLNIWKAKFIHQQEAHLVSGYSCNVWVLTSKFIVFREKLHCPSKPCFSLKQDERNRGPHIHHLNKQKSFGLEVSGNNCRPSLFRISFYNYPFSMEICIFYLLYCHGEYKGLQLLNVLEQLLVLD